jgi:hypothetical protein
MTEPTHHYRRDTEAQLDNLTKLLYLQLGPGDVDAARRDLREALANAWTAGWVAAELPRAADAELARNPYDETDKA